MKLDPSTDQPLMDIITLYYDKENFFINDFNLELLNRISQILTQLPLSDLFLKDELSGFSFILDFDQLKTFNPENFIVIMKYIQIFGEESFAFIKVIAHYYLYKKEMFAINRQIHLRIKNAKEMFLIESIQQLKVNSYVQLYGRVTSISPIKIFHTKINYFCSNCGLIVTKSLMFNNPKKVNSLIHDCQNGKNEEPKITKEYIEPIYIRYLNIDVNGENVLCMIKEDIFSMPLLNENVKISGVVKTRNENEKKENLFIKYINLNQIEAIPFNRHFIPSNIDELKRSMANVFPIKRKFSYCYNKLIPKIDYPNLLLFYYLFSLSEKEEQNLKIQIINLTKSELSNVQNIQNLENQFPSMFKVLQNEVISFNQKSSSAPFRKAENENFVNNYNSHLVILNNELKSSNLETKNCLKNENYGAQYYNSNYIQNEKKNRSVLSIAESFDVNVNGYDIISIVHEMNNTMNDRKQSNKIISNQFAGRKKRNFTSMQMENTQINKVDKISNFSDDLFTLDSLSLIDYFKNEIFTEEENKKTSTNLPSIDDYITFVNKYVNPAVSQEAYNDIYFLSEHLKNQFKDLMNCSLFDLNWITLSTLIKISKITAKIEMRDIVTKEDIIKGYLITKEFLQENYVFFLLNKKEKAKGKKAKISFIIEKLRQFSLTSGKKITAEQIKSFGCFEEEEYNNLIDKLNYEGVLLKIGSQEFQISG